MLGQWFGHPQVGDRGIILMIESKYNTSWFTLQVVDVPTIDNRECEGWHRDKGIRVVIYDEMMCAGYYDGGKDSCQGDSGGPLMTEIEGRWTLIGIVSAGYSCAKRGQPGIYHRVSHTSDWISHSIST